MIKKAFWLLSISILIFSYSCRKSGVVVTKVPEDFNIEDQIIIGNEIKKQIEFNTSSFNPLERSTNPEAYEYLNTLLNTLLFTPMIQNRTKLDWNLTIIQNDSLEAAFVLPGGHIYLYTGLLKFIDSEHQFLGVLAHELYYADTELMVQRIKSAFGGIIMGDILLGNPIEGLGGMVEEIPYLGFTEDEVLQADTYATQIMCLFQYSPLGLQEVIEKASNSSKTIHWLENRYCNEKTRFENFDMLTIDCEIDGVTNQENYQRFKEQYLP